MKPHPLKASIHVSLQFQRSFCSFPSALRLGQPALTLHVQPFSSRLVFLIIGAHSEHVSVEILDLHLAGPRVVRGRMADLRSGAAILFQQGISILDADPNPRAGMALVAFAQKNVASAA